MPNNGRITVCPFYRDEKNKSISCEDVYRTFRYAKQKWEWMDRYCDLDWEKCPYAKDLLKVYDRIEKGDDNAMLEHIIEALKKEFKRLKTMLGRAEKRLEAKDEEIRDLRKKNRVLEELYNTVRNDCNEQRKRAEYLNGKLFHALPAYEARFCYLMELYSGGTFDEIEYTEWSRGKEFRLEAVKDEDGNVVAWKSNVREAKDEPVNVYSDTKKE